MMSVDASATYRGYRRQALYVLSRVLTDAEADKRVYVPEGAEDVAIFNLNQELIESVQVKDYTSPLALSHFKPKSPEGFFARLMVRRRDHPCCVSYLATFGELGPELSGAITGTDPARNEVITKLTTANINISKTEAGKLLDCLQGKVMRPDEKTLRTEIFKILLSTIAGGHVDRSLELLLYWMFVASEEKRPITREIILAQLQRIGQFLAGLRDSSTEWMATIRPIDTLVQTEGEKQRLRGEYYSGVQARWAHISAGVDCPRSERLDEIHGKFRLHSIVVVRGASGQGKSTLGWRYLHDYSTDHLRYEVRMIQSREHALRVANALRSHISSLRLNAIVWLDLAPTDSGWPELLRELADAGIKVLVAVREEDFRRSALTAIQVGFGEVVLNSLTEKEAEQIFAELIASKSDKVLDFTDAWQKFGANGGPLLEFTHFVTQGRTLIATIGGQLRRLADEAACNTGKISARHLKALALGSVALAAGCRVDGSKLCDAVGLDQLTLPFSYLEEEYLLRVGGGGIISGLHILRSDAICQVLLGGDLVRWREHMIACLGFILDEDLETFLHQIFSRRPAFSSDVRAALAALPLRTWTQAGGIARALLWEGMSRYEEENRQKIGQLIATYDTAWIYICDSFIGGGDQALQELRKGLKEALKTDIPFTELTPKVQVYGPIREWVACAIVPSEKPSRASDWSGIGDISYWCGAQKLSGAIREELERLSLAPLPLDLDLAALSNTVSGFHALQLPEFAMWYQKHEEAIKAKFVDETGSIHLEDDGARLTVVFALNLIDGIEPDGTGEQKAQKLLRQMRDLFPYHSRIASESVGAEFISELMPLDPTKNDVDASTFVSTRVARLNGTFGNLVTYRHSRRSTWREYIDTIFNLRIATNEAFRGLYRGWSKLIGDPRIDARNIMKLPGKPLEAIRQHAKQPKLPQAAVDEWGYTSESQNQQKEEGADEAASVPLRRFEKWRKAFGGYASSLNNFTQQAINETAVFAVKKAVEPADPVDPDGGRLLFANLGEAWRELQVVQAEFRRHFGKNFSVPRLVELETHERINFQHLWSIAYWLVRDPRRTSSNPVVEQDHIFVRQRAEFLKAIERHARESIKSSGGAYVRLDERVVMGEKSLILVCDHTTVQGVNGASAGLIPSLWKAAHEQPLRPFEWMPFVVEFPQILLTHTFRGKALTAAATRLDTYTLFVREDRAAMPHELILSPMDLHLFAEIGVPVHDSPAVSAAIAWNSALGAFSISLMRMVALLQLTHKYKFTQETLSRVAERFSRETTKTLSAARQAADSLVELLKPIASHAAAGAEAMQWIDRVNALTPSTLTGDSSNPLEEIGVDRFVTWIEGNHQRVAETTEITAKIVETYGR